MKNAGKAILVAVMMGLHCLSIKAAQEWQEHDPEMREAMQASLLELDLDDQVRALRDQEEHKRDSEIEDEEEKKEAEIVTEEQVVAYQKEWLRRINRAYDEQQALAARLKNDMRIPRERKEDVLQEFATVENNLVNILNKKIVTDVDVKEAWILVSRLQSRAREFYKEIGKQYHQIGTHQNLRQ